LNKHLDFLPALIFLSSLDLYAQCFVKSHFQRGWIAYLPPEMTVFIYASLIGTRIYVAEILKIGGFRVLFLKVVVAAEQD